MLCVFLQFLLLKSDVTYSMYKWQIKNHSVGRKTVEILKAR
jgi:hypothetical protein